jgi:hypothetical protein
MFPIIFSEMNYQNQFKAANAQRSRFPGPSFTPVVWFGVGKSLESIDGCEVRPPAAVATITIAQYFSSV